MVVRVIKNTEPKNINIPAAAVTGAAAGLALRQFVPPNKQEIDTVLFSHYDALKEGNVASAKEKVIEKAEKLFAEHPDKKELELFIERAKAQTVEQALAAKKKIKGADEAVKKNVQLLVDDLAVKMKFAKHLTESGVKSYVKQFRPIAGILIPGAAIGALGAFIYNTIGQINQD